MNPINITENGPAVMISNTDGLALKTYIDSNPGAMVTIDLNGLEQDLTTWSSTFGFGLAANQFASFSSQGPTPDGQLKPDMVATGGLDGSIQVDANDPYLPAPAGMYSASQNYDPNMAYAVSVFSSNRFAAGDGTSFSAPLTAGAAALLRQAHPSLRPTQIKSLLVNYSDQTVTTDDFGDAVDAEWIGAGLLNAGASASASVTAEPSTISFGILNSATLPITKTITLTNISSGAISLNASVSCCSVNAGSGTLSGATVGLSSSSVSLAANGGTASLTVTLSGSKPAVGEYSGDVVLQNSSTTLRIPFMLLLRQRHGLERAPAGWRRRSSGRRCRCGRGAATDPFGVPVTGSSVTFSVTPRGTATLQSVTGEPACSPTSSTSSVSCPTDQFGYAYVEVVNGSAVASPTVNYSGSGFNSVTVGSGFSYNIQAAPVITSASVVDAAAYKQPIAPGSYVNIYGTGLSNYTDIYDATTDALSPNGTYSTLPLHIDFVTVTFDVPSAGISVPARVTYVCSKCINGTDEYRFRCRGSLPGSPRRR